MSFLRKIFFYVVFMNMTYSLFSNLDFASRDSRFVVSGGSLNIVSPIQNWTGTLQLVSGSITGNSIVLNEGQVRTTKGVLETTGQVTPSATPIVTLRTNEKVVGSAGVLIDSLNVRGTGNILAGQPDFIGTSTLLNGLAELQIQITNRLNQSILMNNGKITLLNDLTLGDNTILTGSGRVDLNYKTLRMPAKETTWTSKLYFIQANDVVLNAKTSLTGTWTFEGSGAVLQGNGNILDLTSGGTLWIKSGADVELTDIHVRGLGTIYGNIVFEDATSRIRLSNATLQLASNYTVTQGGIYVEGANSSIITGTSTLTIATGASMTVDRVTLFADALDATSTVNVSPNIPDGLKLIYKNNGILKASNDNNLAIANSNAIVGWIKDTSNVMVSTYNLVVQSSAAIINNSNRITANSQAIKSMSQGITNNSNAIVGWAKDTSNAVSGLMVDMSNAIVSLGGNTLAVDNSQAIVGWIKDTSNAVAGLLVAVSNGVSADHTLLVNTSNAVSGLLVVTSNAVVASKQLAVDSSQAIVGWIKDTSNSLGSVDISAALGTIDHGPAHIHMSAAMTMSYNVYISANHSFYIHSSGVINGAGHRVNFANNVVPMMLLDTGVTVTFENIELFDYSDDKVSFGVGSNIIFGTGCRVHIDNINLITRVWRCAGQAEIYGRGNEVIIFDDESGIEVSPASQVLIHDIRLSGVEGTRVYCLTNESSILFDNAQIVLSNNYSFTMGSMKFYRDVTWASTMLWHYTSAMGSTIDSQARLIFDRGLSWHYDPSIANKYGIIFTDSSAQWLLNGNELLISPTGIQLTKGHWVIDDENVLVGQGTTLSEAIILGNGISDDDFDLELLPAATITLTSGVIDYQNIA